MEVMDVNQFKERYVKKFEEMYAFDYKEGSEREQFLALGYLIKNMYALKWRQTSDTYLESKSKQVFYFSMEFLPGTMLKSNLLNMGLLDVVSEGLKDLGLDLDEVATGEMDPALGNGGLGRLAACFMDSIASNGLAGLVSKSTDNQ